MLPGPRRSALIPVAGRDLVPLETQTPPGRCAGRPGRSRRQAAAACCGEEDRADGRDDRPEAASQEDPDDWAGSLLDMAFVARLMNPETSDTACLPRAGSASTTTPSENQEPISAERATRPSLLASRLCFGVGFSVF